MERIYQFLLFEGLTPLNKTGRWCSIASALVGVLILVFYAITKIEMIALSGFLFLIGAFAINSVVLIGLLFSLITNKTQPYQKETLITIGMMLGTAVLAVVCAYLGVRILDLSELD